MSSSESFFPPSVEVPVFHKDESTWSQKFLQRWYKVKFGIHHVNYGHGDKCPWRINYSWGKHNQYLPLKEAEFQELLTHARSWKFEHGTFIHQFTDSFRIQVPEYAMPLFVKKLKDVTL